MSINFNRIWASDTNPDYPTDSQTKRGLSYLGTEAPTFDLHDAIFQDHDLKAQWLYDQIRLLCERYGQSVSESVAGSARDTMANAVTAAILNQRRADEGGYGIVKMADAAQTNAGNDYNFAVSPKHLAEYVSTQNTWSNTKDKPQTALRWPTWDETTNKPTFGSAAWKGFFDTGDAESIPYGADSAASTGCVAAVRDAAKNDTESVRKTLKASAFKGVFDGDFASIPADKELLATARTVSEVRDRVLDVQSKLSNLDSSLDDHSKVGSLVIAMRINDGQQINYPSLTDGYLLRPSACGEYGSDMGPLPGTWKCLGASRWAGDPRGDGSKTTLYRRVR